MSARRGSPSDLTDAQGDLVKDLWPEPSGDGRPEKHPRREIVNAILSLVRSGCPWRYLPADLPPWQTVYWHFVRREGAGVTEKLLAALRVKARVAQGREPDPSAGVLDSPSVKGADTVGNGSRGYDAGKKTSGAEMMSSSGGWLLVAADREGDGFAEGDAVVEAVVQTADHAVEQVALGSGMPVAGLPSAVVVGSGAGGAGECGEGPDVADGGEALVFDLAGDYGSAFA